MSKLYTCTVCGKKKQQSEFHKRTSRPKGITSSCKDCISKRDLEYRNKNADILSQKRKEKYNTEDYKVKQQEYRDANRERIRNRDREYYLVNKESLLPKKNADSAKRYAKQTCPSWLSKDEISKIKSIYKLCRSLSKKTGIRYEVDHIVPLQGEAVCGLHVPWNLQVLKASENLSKGNRIVL